MTLNRTPQERSNRLLMVEQTRFLHKSYTKTIQELHRRNKFDITGTKGMAETLSSHFILTVLMKVKPDKTRKASDILWQTTQHILSCGVKRY